MILLRHLLPSQFKIIRYYGFYRKKHSIHNKMIPLIKDHLRTFRRKLLKHELSISLAFHRNPYNCPKCKYKFDAPIEAVLEFEQEDEWNGLPISTPPYTICAKCKFDKCVPIDYVSRRGFYHIYKDN